ncbi:hypothetical protein [Arthrobacter sp. MMS24-S77]
METMSIAGLHRKVARMDIHELVRNLNSGLGPTLVAALSGAANKSLAIKWAKDDGPQPRADKQNKLRLGYEIWLQLVQAEGTSVARSWFIGGNPLLDEDTPLSAIREGRGKAVRNAADAMVEDRQDI